MSTIRLTQGSLGGLGLSDADFEAIESAVMETARGRWFLAEYARRQRRAETESILAALDALGRMIQRQQRPALSSNVSARLLPGLRVQLPSRVTDAPPVGLGGPQSAALAHASSMPASGSEQMTGSAKQSAEQALLRSALVGDEQDTLDYHLPSKVA